MKRLSRTFIALLAAMTAFETGMAKAEISLIAELMKAPEAIVSVTAENASINVAPRPQIAGKTASGRPVLSRSIIPAKFTRKGTGIIVTSQGLIAVNVHTIKQAARIKVTLADGTSFMAKPVQVDGPHDVALIEIQSLAELPYLKLADSSQAKLNSRVFSVGGSALLKNTISEGKLRGIGQKKSGSSLEDKTAQIFQVSFDLYQGDSGSPVFNERGEVLGIISAGAQHIGKTTFAIPSNFIRDLLNRR